ncbi:flagellar hook-length control protein FliK [Vallitaleaceae bacterium 9-2]
MNSIAMNFVANMLNTQTFNEGHYVNRSEQSTSGTKFKDVIQKTQEGITRSNDTQKPTREQELKRYERPNERTTQSLEARVVENEESVVGDNANLETKADIKEVEVLDESALLKGIEQMDTISLEIMQAIADLMNVSIDEIQATLEQLDMKIEDLFDSNQLMKFMTAQMGLDSSTEVLTTEGAMTQYKQVASLMEEFSKPFMELKQWLSEQGVQMTDQSKEQIVLNPETVSEVQPETKQSDMNFSKEESSELFSSKELDKPLVATGTEDKNAMPSGFETTLNQVVTEKVETLVMNGELRTVYTEVTTKDVFDQIVTGLKVEVTQGKQDIILQLQPENLGKIAVNISKENGVMTGQFIAESEAVKSLIEKNVPILKQQLEAQGIDLRDVKIVVGDSKAFFAGKDSERDTQNFQQTMSQNKKRHTRINRVEQMLNEQLEENDGLEQASHIDTEMSSIEFQA